MRYPLALFFVATLLLGSAPKASAIEFKARGAWEMYFNAGRGTFYNTDRDARNTGTSRDAFEANTRLRLRLEAIASENLSGTVQFEIGTVQWGNGPNGGALGTDGINVEVKHAYLDWLVPDTKLHIRMGLQAITLPNVAGGSAVFDDDIAAIVLSYSFNENVGLTALWARPFNDNYSPGIGNNEPANHVDNYDLFMLSMPLTFDGIRLVPWLMTGMIGRNMLFSEIHATKSAGYVPRGIYPVDLAQFGGRNYNLYNDYSIMFWAGLPLRISYLDPFSLEIDLNYGYSSGWGKYSDAAGRRNDTRREGFLVKALAEYKLDWGIPGILGWYASGDDGDPRNGSERMPTVSPVATFTSFGFKAYQGHFSRVQIGESVDTTYTGTWGLGAQLRNLSFIDDLSHTLRLVYFRGTNDASMASKLGPTGWNQYSAGVFASTWGGLYLTTNDYLIEFNLDSRYAIYENLEAFVELGYIINGVDKDSWHWQGNQKGDGWKAVLNLRYSF